LGTPGLWYPAWLGNVGTQKVGTHRRCSGPGWGGAGDSRRENEEEVTEVRNLV